MQLICFRNAQNLDENPPKMNESISEKLHEADDFLMYKWTSSILLNSGDIFLVSPESKLSTFSKTFSVLLIL